MPPAKGRQIRIGKNGLRAFNIDSRGTLYRWLQSTYSERNGEVRQEETVAASNDLSIPSPLTSLTIQSLKTRIACVGAFPFCIVSQ